MVSTYVGWKSLMLEPSHATQMLRMLLSSPSSSAFQQVCSAVRKPSYTEPAASAPKMAMMSSQ